MEVTAATRPRFWRRWNWWKISFFVTLLAFEVAREWAVMASFADAKPNVTFNLFHMETFTTAHGVWKRTDGGGKMMPAIISVECDESVGRCIMVDTHFNGEWVFAPNISVFDAKFAPDSITFDDDQAECATLKFRIDLKLEKVNAMRVTKPSVSGIEMCKQMEKRMDLTLGDADLAGDPVEGHFLPVLIAVRSALSIF